MKSFKVVSVLLIAATSAILWFAACSKDNTSTEPGKTTDPSKFAKALPSYIFPSNANMHGKSYNEWSKEWIKWVYNLNCSLLNSGTGTAISSTFSSNVYFMTCPCFGVSQSITVPKNKSLLFPIGWTLYDYPCSNDPLFQPAPGETLQHFLTEGAKSGIDPFDSLSIELDGVLLTGLGGYRTAAYFNFTGNAAMAACWDPCVTGTSQPGASDGYWYMLKPLSVGTHTLKTRAIYIGYGPTEEATYTIVVQP